MFIILYTLIYVAFVGFGVILDEAAVAFEGFDAGLLAAEVDVEFHGVDGVAVGEEEAELFGELGVVEVAAFAEGLEGVGVEDGRPSVAIVTCGVSAAEDVLVVSALVAADDFGYKADFSHCLVFEVGEYDFGRLSDAVEVHIEQRSCQQLGVDEALSIGGGGGDFGDKAVGDGLAGFVVACVILHDLRIAAPVFHNLRGHFDEVARDVGTAEGAVVALAEHAVQAVAELVEESFRLVEVEQRRFILGGFGEVANHLNDGDDVVAILVDVLLAEIGHPSAAAFAFAREEVHIEDGDDLIAVEHLVADGLGVVFGQRVVDAEGDAVEFVGDGESALTNIVEREVGSDEVFVEAVAFGAEAFAVVAPIPGLQFFAGEVFVEHFLVFVAFLFSLFESRCPEVHEAFVDSFGSFCQAVVECVGGVAFEAKDLSALEAEVDDAVDDGAVVVFARGAARRVGVPHLFAEVAVVASLHEGFPARHVESEDGVAIGASLEGSGELVVGEANGASLVGIERQLVFVGGGEDVVAEAQRE